MDCITLEDFEVICVIGDLPEERTSPQVICLDVKLYADLTKVCESDRLADTVDYAKLVQTIRTDLDTYRYYMIEAAAQKVADCCMAYDIVDHVEVHIRKPGAMHGVRAGVHITRMRADYESD